MSGFLDWQDHALPYIKGKKMVEFGLGKGTKYLLDNCEKVHSIEINLGDREWYDICVEEYKNSPKWSVEIFLVDEDKYDKKLAKEIQDIAQGYDVAFVDPGVHFRPEVVNALFGHVNVIIAHDTFVGEEDYHWKRIKSPKGYKRIDFTHGQGTSIWVKH